MQHRAPALACLIAAGVVALACSSTTSDSSTSPAPTPDDDSSQGGDAGADGPAPDAAADAAPQLEEVDVGSDTAGTTCTSVCKTAGYVCSPTCKFDELGGSGKAAGEATYRDSSKDNHFEPVLTCDDAIPAVYDDGTKWNLGAPDGLDHAIYCCCLGRAHTKVSGDTKNPKSCDDVCKAKGLTCDPSKTLGGYTSLFSCTSSVSIQGGGGCTDPPPASENDNGTPCALSSFTCECW